METTTLPCPIKHRKWPREYSPYMIAQHRLRRIRPHVYECQHSDRRFFKPADKLIEIQRPHWGWKR